MNVLQIGAFHLLEVKRGLTRYFSVPSIYLHSCWYKKAIFEVRNLNEQLSQHAKIRTFVTHFLLEDIEEEKIIRFYDKIMLDGSC
jgi:hypothetical protein